MQPSKPAIIAIRIAAEMSQRLAPPVNKLFLDGRKEKAENNVNRFLDDLTSESSIVLAIKYFSYHFSMEAPQRNT
jgi:hypothetical protein